MEDLQAKLKEFADNIRKQAEEALTDFECEVLPYVAEDTAMNAVFRSEDIVRKLIAGQFEIDDGYAIVEMGHEINQRIRIQFSDRIYDELRDSIIERMDECPKDAKIRSLEAEIEQLYRRGL